MERKELEELQEPVGTHLFFYSKQNKQKTTRSKKQLRSILQRNLLKLRSLNISPKHVKR